MKKGLILSLALFLALFLCACGGQKTAEAPTGEKEYLVDPAVDFVATVDEKGWDAAMAAENFKNVTVNGYSSDSEGQPFGIIRVSGDRSYQFRIAGEASSDGPSYRHECHDYYYTENGVYYHLDNTTTTNLTTNEATTKYEIEETETYEGENAQTLTESDNYPMAALRGQYSSFTYNEDEQLYTGTLEGMDSKIEVSFQDGKLVYVKVEWDGYWQSTEFVNYGTTTVEIPEKG